MDLHWTTPLLTQRVRAHRGYRILPRASWGKEELARLGGLAGTSEIAALLVPRAGYFSLPSKVVDGDTAALFGALAEPAVVPGELTEAPRAFGRLLLDAVLEVEHAGRWITGADVLVVLDEGGEGAPTSALGELSLRALRQAIHLGDDRVDVLTRAIYTFHRLPMSPRWHRLVPDEHAAEEMLFSEGVHAKRRLRSSWNRVEAEAWHLWSGPNSPGARVHKLYVSPRPDAVPAAFAALVDVAERCRASAFKVARDPEGWLRPDKMVAYFDGREALERAAASLMSRLEGLPAHGVPFTAAFDEAETLVSWGVDPSEGAWRVDPDGRGESWRLWLARRLASAVSSSMHRGSVDDVLRFALARLREDGVDVGRWTPTSHLRFQ